MIDQEVRKYELRFANLGGASKGGLAVGRYAWIGIIKLKAAIDDVRKYAVTPYIDVWEEIDGDRRHDKVIMIDDTPDTIYKSLPDNSYQFVGWISTAEVQFVDRGLTIPSVLCQKRLKARNNFKELLEGLNALSLLNECTPNSYEVGDGVLKCYLKCTNIERTLDEYIESMELAKRLHLLRDELSPVLETVSKLEMTDDAGEDWHVIYYSVTKLAADLKERMDSAAKIEKRVKQGSV